MSHRMEIPQSIEGLVRDNIGYSHSTISAMKLAGLKFTHGLKTTRSSVLRFMAANPHFRVADFYGPGRLKPAELVVKYPQCSEKVLAGRVKVRVSPNTAPVPPCPPADISDAQLLTHG